MRQEFEYTELWELHEFIRKGYYPHDRLFHQRRIVIDDYECEDLRRGWPKVFIVHEPGVGVYGFTNQRIWA